MKSILKENFVLIAGIALPLLLALGFLAATKLSAIGIDPPKTAVLYSFKNYGLADFQVRDGAVYYIEREPRQKGQNYQNLIELYLYDPVSDEQTRIDLPVVPEDGPGKDGILIEGLKGRTVSTTEKSPDGFVFRNGWDDYYNHGFVLDIFGGGRSRRGAYLQNEGLKVRVPEPRNTYYGQPAFIGWVTE